MPYLFPSSIVVQITLDPLIARLSIEEPGAKPAAAKPAGTGTGAALPADDFANIVGGNAQFEDDRLFTFDLSYLNLIRGVDQRFIDVLD